MDLLTTNQSETSADIELELEYEIEEDIEAELENFVRMNHTGQFEDAHELFDECLSSHDDWYPIAAEYADCLLREGKFKQLADFSRKASMTFQEPGEKTLLLLMEMIGKRAPRDIMRQQLQALWPADVFKPPYTSLKDTQALWPADVFKPPYTSLKDTDIHIKEMFLLALVLTRPNQVLEVSLTPDSTSAGPWNAAKDLFYYLLHNQLFWEAQRVLQSLLHIVSLDESQTMVHDYIRKAVSTGIGEESVQIAVSSLVQRFIFVTESRPSSPLAVVPWNDAITWALFGVTLAKKTQESVSLFKCIHLRRSLQEELAPNLGMTLPLDSVHRNDNIYDSLYEAVSDGDVSMMRQAMIVSPTRYSLDEVNSVALLEAAQRSSEKDVLEFLSSDTVHARDGYQRTALHWAALKCDWQTIDILLMQGKADPGSLDWFGCTPLHYAVKTLDGGQEKAAHSLLRFNAATVNTKNLSGLGPIHTAILDGSRIIADLLFQYGATLEKSDIGALPPLDFGASKWYYEYLLLGGKKNRSDVGASTTSDLTSLEIPLDSFQSSDLPLTEAKHGVTSKRRRSSTSDQGDSISYEFRKKSNSERFVPRVSRSHLLADMRTAPKPLLE